MNKFVKTVLGAVAVMSISACAGRTSIRTGPVVQTPAAGVTLSMRRLVNTTDTLGVNEARYAFRWLAPTLGPNNQPIAGYDLQVLLGDSVVVNRRESADAVTDTVGLPLPPLDSVSGPYKAQIRAVDTKDRVSVWVATDEWGITREGDAPPPPSGFGVDTVFPTVAQIIIRPRIDSLEVGEQTQLCGIVIHTDGTTALANNPGSQTAVCQQEYAAWQQESFGNPNLVLAKPVSPL